MLTTTAVEAAQTPIVINLRNIGGVTPGSQAYYGFKTAAKFWESYLTTSQPTTINIDVGFAPLPDRVLGSTRSTFTSKTVQGIESRLGARQFGAFDAAAVAHLPTLALGQLGVGALSVYTPGYTDPVAKTGIDNATKVYDTDGSYNNSVIGLTTANAKALGYTAGQIYSATNPTQRDASITFSSTFAFDFDPKERHRRQQLRFPRRRDPRDRPRARLHQRGRRLRLLRHRRPGRGRSLLRRRHAVQELSCQRRLVRRDPRPVPLQRAAGALDWTTNTSSYFSVDGGASAFQSGLFSTGEYTGDGSQASHWIDNPRAPRINPNCTNNTAPSIGIMNPTIGACEQDFATALDLAAFDAIGYNSRIDVLANPTFKISTNNISSFVPEPATWAMMIGGFGFVGSAMRRRRTGFASA